MSHQYSAGQLSLFRSAFITFVALTLASCGGGGDGSTITQVPTGFQVSSGVVQKGPLLRGSVVTVNELNPSTFQPAGSSFNFEVADDYGTFKPSGTTFTRQYLETTATGYYFDELTGAPSSNMVILRALSNLDTDRAVNVNVLTDLANTRLRTLLTRTTDPLRFGAARQQAQREVLRAFYINNPSDLLGGADSQPGSFGELDLAKTRQADQMLAAVSALVTQVGKTGSGINLFVNRMKADLADDGLLNNSTGFAEGPGAQLNAAMAQMDWSKVATNLNTFYRTSAYTTANLKQWADSSGGVDRVLDGAKFFDGNVPVNAESRSPQYSVTTDDIGQCVGSTAGKLYRNAVLVTGSAVAASGDKFQMVLTGLAGETITSYLQRWAPSGAGCSTPAADAVTRLYKATAKFEISALLAALRTQATLGSAYPTAQNPPVVTPGIKGAASQITGSQLVAWNSGKFLYTGNMVVASTTNYPDYLFGQNRAVSYAATFQSSTALNIEFVTDAASLEVFSKGTAWSGQFLFVVDGELASELSVTYPSDGALYLTKVDFGSTKSRRVRILATNPFFGGIRIPPGATVSLPPAETNKFRAMFVGDSITEGPAGQAEIYSFASYAARMLGWKDAWISGVGATGYLAAPAPKLTFRQRFQTDIKAFAPNVLVFAGGINDQSFTDAQVQAEAGLLFDQIQAELPNTIVFVLGPWNPRSATRPSLNVAIKAAAAGRRNFYWVPGFEDAWITGTGRVGSPRFDGNSDLVVSADGTHPSPYGIKYLANKFAESVKALINQ